MSPAELRRRLHDLLGSAQPPSDLAARALARIEAQPRAPHLWAVGVAVAVVLFGVVFAGAFTTRSLHSAPRAAKPSPSAPLAIGGGVQSGAPVVDNGATPPPPAGGTAIASPSAAVTPASASPSPVTGRSCTASDLRLTTRVDSTQYAVGQTVHLASDAHNVSASPCVIGISCVMHLVVDDSSGQTVYPSRGPMYYLCAMPKEQLLAPGAAATITADWDQKGGCDPPGGTCAGTQVPVGTYTAHGAWGELPDASPVSFVIGTVAPCTPSDVSVTAATDKTTYTVGATVAITATITDKASQPCSYMRGQTNPSFTVSNAGGTVWTSCNQRAACSDALTTVVIFPNQGDSVSTTWSQQECNAGTCTVPQPGPYQATVSFGQLGSASTAFAFTP